MNSASPPRGAVVRVREISAEPHPDGASVRTLLDTGAGGPGLVRRQVEVPQGSGYRATSGDAGDLCFVIDGAGHLEAGGQSAALTPDRGLLIPAGSEFGVHADQGSGLRVDIVSLPATETPAGTSDTDGLQTRDFADCEIEFTGDRQFRVLFGPGFGCSIATQFVGEIPPGRAPEHSHPYDEVVLILGGDGTAHIGGGDYPLSPGTCLHLPPGLPHCLENTGPASLRVLGVFHPADSPAAKLPSGQ